MWGGGSGRVNRRHQTGYDCQENGAAALQLCCWASVGPDYKHAIQFGSGTWDCCFGPTQIKCRLCARTKVRLVYGRVRSLHACVWFVCKAKVRSPAMAKNKQYLFHTCCKSMKITHISSESTTVSANIQVSAHCAATDNAPPFGPFMHTDSSESQAPT